MYSNLSVLYHCVSARGLTSHTHRHIGPRDADSATVTPRKSRRSLRPSILTLLTLKRSASYQIFLPLQASICNLACNVPSSEQHDLEDACNPLQIYKGCRLLHERVASLSERLHLFVAADRLRRSLIAAHSWRLQQSIFLAPASMMILREALFCAGCGSGQWWVSTAGNGCVLLASSTVGIPTEPVVSAESKMAGKHNFSFILPERRSLVLLVRC